MTVQVCHRPGYPADAAESTGGQLVPAVKLLHEILRCHVHHAVFIEQIVRYHGIAVDGSPGKALVLDLTGFPDAFPDGSAGFGFLLGRQLLDRHGVYVNVQVKAIEHGTGDLVEVGTHLFFGAGAFFEPGAEIAARTGIHGSHEHDIAGEHRRSGNTGDSDLPFLQRLTEHIEGGAVKFRQLVQKQHAVVGK